MNTMACVFCEINKDFTRVIREKTLVYVAMSNPRLMKGHLLIIPRRHVEKPSELNAEERKELFDTAIEFQERIISKLSTGCDIRQHFRPFLPEGKIKVNHVHLHLLPRDFEDELYKKSLVFEKDLFQDLTEEETKRYIQLFSSK